jgi:acyl-CoA thioester hydrolase
MKADFTYFYPLRVRFAETDMQAIVFNGNYLVYYDTAWTEYFRAMNFPYEKLTALGVDTVLAKTTLEFKAPAHFDELLEIYVRVSKIGNTSMTLDFEIYQQGNEALLNKASSLYVCIDPKSMRPTPVPALLRESISRFESKEF